MTLGGLRIRQSRFSYLPEPGRPRWQVPVSLALWRENGQTGQETLLLLGSSVGDECGPD